MKDDDTTSSHYLTYTFSSRGWENVLFELGSERVKHSSHFTPPDFCYRDADHYWPLDKVSPGGSVAKASTSRPAKAHGGLYVAVGETRNGTAPVALYLDGSGSWVDLGDFKGTCVSDPSRCVDGLSLSFKVNIQGSGTGYLLSSGGQSGRGLAVYYASGSLFIQVKDGEKRWQVETGYSVNTWQTISFSWSQQDGLSVVLDEGRLHLKDTAGKLAMSALDSDTSVVIGRPNDEKSKYGKGLIRDLAIWERPLYDVKLEALHRCNGTLIVWLSHDVGGHFSGGRGRIRV